MSSKLILSIILAISNGSDNWDWLKSQCESENETDTLPDYYLHTNKPTNSPTSHPIKIPTQSPTTLPTIIPTKSPTILPTESPTKLPTKSPTYTPTPAPLIDTSPKKLPKKKPKGKTKNTQNDQNDDALLNQLIKGNQKLEQLKQGKITIYSLHPMAMNKFELKMLNQQSDDLLIISNIDFVANKYGSSLKNDANVNLKRNQIKEWADAIDSIFAASCAIIDVFEEPISEFAHKLYHWLGFMVRSFTATQETIDIFEDCWKKFTLFMVECYNATTNNENLFLNSIHDAFLTKNETNFKVLSNKEIIGGNVIYPILYLFTECAKNSFQTKIADTIQLLFSSDYIGNNRTNETKIQWGNVLGSMYANFLEHLMRVVQSLRDLTDGVDIRDASKQVTKFSNLAKEYSMYVNQLKIAKHVFEWKGNKRTERKSISILILDVHKMDLYLTHLFNCIGMYYQKPIFVEMKRVKANMEVIEQKKGVKKSAVPHFSEIMK